jgi:putative transposase
MAQHQGRWPVSVLCEVLQVSRSGFYTYGQRQTSVGVEAAEAPLVARVQAIAAETRHSYGSRRMAKQLQDDGFAVGRDKARRLMRQAQVTVERPKKRGPVTTDSRHSYAVAPNVLARQFDVEQPDQVWGGDITYIWTTDGGLYLAV